MKKTNIYERHKDLTIEFHYLREALEYPEAHDNRPRQWFKDRYEKVWEELKEIVYDNRKLCLDLP